MKWIVKNNIGIRMIMLFSGDSLLCVLAFIFCACKITGNNISVVIDNNVLSVKIPVFVISVIFFSFFIEVYSGRKHFDRKSLIIRSFFANILSFVSLFVIYYFIPILKIDSKLLVYTLAVFFVLQSVWHILFHIVIRNPLFVANVLILGTGPKAKDIAKHLINTNSNYLLKGFIATPYDPLVIPPSDVVGDINSVLERAKRERVHTIVIALTERRSNLPTHELLKCKLSGINVVELPSFFELIAGKLMVEDIHAGWFLHSDGFRITLFIKFYKRVSDLFFSFAGLLLSVPLYPVIALFIKLSSSGPVFYKQVRTGENGKNFSIYKFRTMRQDAEAESGAVWSGEDDPRITKTGRLMRKTRIDELPQLFNVLKGDMSFIGPRPERPELVKQIVEVTKFYEERHFVKPGLTGWAQIKYPYGASFGDAIEKLRYDLYYVKNISFTLDLMILINTIKVIILGRGGR
ncbi:MAG: TIGR03013 family XrtA/PEP-CTERM system glycosyltransferase [Candidatus Anammoxibacter sp.]